ncbi:MAGUK p55 subfamily member 4 [Nibea albiflora]|uniref:MAGUK p55 subfamily member 4 n=1 Tax=Nibea albiflora TaxID=240163 RepID=A0ACB7EEG6_NIBAL|nr:MAGUK p55 subfamily member 4 [Nibea albiflora]
MDMMAEEQRVKRTLTEEAKKRKGENVSEVLSSVVEDIGQAVHRNVSGAQLLQELLNAPWLHALLEIYECLLRFQRLTPSPILPYALGLSHEIMSVIQKVSHPSAEARELYSLLSSAHIQALLSSHDSIARIDYGPVLLPLPDEMPEGEEAVRIVCLVKNNQPLNGEVRRGVVGTGDGAIRGRWSSLRRLTLERLVPVRRAWSATAEKHNTGEGASPGGGTEDYAYPPPPVPAHSLPNAPALYKKGATGGHSRTVPTPGRTSSFTGKNSLRAHTAPSSPAVHRSIQQQGVKSLPTPGRQHRYQTGSHSKHQELQNRPVIQCSTAPCHKGHQNQPQWTQNEQHQPKLHQHPQSVEFTKQLSMEELRSTVQTVSSSIKHSTQDVHPPGHKMMAGTEMITDNVEDNAQALNLLTEVVDKLQGLIVASKQPKPSPSCRPTQHAPPTPPPRVSTVFPKVVRKPPTPYPCHLSSSSSSGSSSPSSVSSCADSLATSRSLKQINGGSKKKAVTFVGTHKAGGNGSNGQVRLNNGSISRAPLEDQQDRNTTGCLTTKKKKKN